MATMTDRAALIEAMARAGRLDVFTPGDHEMRLAAAALSIAEPIIRAACAKIAAAEGLGLDRGLARRIAAKIREGTLSAHG